MCQSQSSRAASELVEVGPECGWLARQLKVANKRRIGLLPASARTDVLPLAEQVGGALRMINDTLVVIIDPDQRSASSGMPTQGAVACAVHSNGLVSLTPVARPADGLRLEAVKALLAFVGESSEQISAVLVDLSSFARPGELLGVLDLLDGIVVVGAAGRVTEQELVTTSQRVPADINLGVVLTN